MAQLEIKPSLWMRTRVFAVMAAGIFISLILVFLLSGGGGEVFASKATLLTFLPNASGLTGLSPVRLNGIVIGKVGRVAISRYMDPQRAVRVEMIVKTRFLKTIPVDSLTSVTADNLVGDKLVSITTGKSPLAVNEGGELPSEPVSQAIDKADLVRTLGRNLEAMDSLLQQLSSKDTKFGNLLLTDDYYETLLSRVVGFNRAIHAVLTPKSDLGKAFYSMEMYQKLRKPVLEFDAQLQAIQKGEGQMGRLFATDQQYDAMLNNLRSLRTSLADANAGKGSLGAVLKTDDDYQKIRQLLRSTDAMISSLNAGDGQLGELLRNPQLYESLNGSLRSMEGLLQDFQGNPKKYLRVKVF